MRARRDASESALRGQLRVVPPSPRVGRWRGKQTGRDSDRARHIDSVCVRERERETAASSAWSHPAQGWVISKSVISYISWDLITPVIRLITFRQRTRLKNVVRQRKLPHRCGSTTRKVQWCSSLTEPLLVRCNCVAVLRGRAGDARALRGVSDPHTGYELHDALPYDRTGYEPRVHMDRTGYEPREAVHNLSESATLGIQPHVG